MSTPTNIQPGIIGSDLFTSQTNAALTKELDSNKVDNKLNGMKRIIGMMSRGENVENFFPAVVKNVITKNISLKKLVYLYLLHYASHRQDEALLSVNNFKNDLQDKNQFIRALALRVMSGIQINLIIEIVLSSIKSCASDKSPYVKKAACLAIPKVYIQDKQLLPELEETLVELLNDRNTMVLGAAIYTFNRVCPSKYEYLHKHYRKLCKYLVDCDEWGQSEIIKCLIRYARTQFLSPFKKDSLKKSKFYEDDEDDYESNSDKEEPIKENFISYELDEDHRLLLTSCLPLLRTRNTGVILQVVSLFFHIAPYNEFDVVVQPLMTLINTTSRENQYCILTNIATIANERIQHFQSFLKDFFVFFSDPLFIRKLKLLLLVTLSNEENVHTLLAEFKTYLRFPEEEFVADTIKSISEIAEKNKEVAESCIYALMKLLSHDSNSVVSQSIVAIHQLIQKDPDKYSKIILKICTLIEKIKSHEAKSCIIWMTGEYYDLIPKIGPDSLRILAKTFPNEHDSVKLQALTLGTKLFLKIGEKVELLYKYVLNLAKYDSNYDIRDKARFLRHLIFNENEECTNLTGKSEQIIFSKKRKGFTSDNSFFNRSKFRIGSLSHLVNRVVNGYIQLSEFPTDMNVENKEERKSSEILGPAQTGNKLEDDLSEGEIGVDFYGTDEDGSDIYTTGSENFFSESEGETEYSGESEEEGEGEVAKTDTKKESKDEDNDSGYESYSGYDDYSTEDEEKEEKKTEKEKESKNLLQFE